MLVLNSGNILVGNSLLNSEVKLNLNLNLNLHGNHIVIIILLNQSIMNDINQIVILQKASSAKIVPLLDFVLL